MRAVFFQWKCSVHAGKWLLVVALLFPPWTTSATVASAQDTLGGHVGFVLPLATRAGGRTTTVADNLSFGFPIGITVKGKGKLAFDLELVPAIQNSPRKVDLTVHPGLIYGIGHNFAVGGRLAFDINSSQLGFTPLINKSWRIKDNFFKAYFVEVVVPVRFNRPPGGPNTNAVGFGVHFGVGF